MFTFELSSTQRRSILFFQPSRIPLLKPGSRLGVLSVAGFLLAAHGLFAAPAFDVAGSESLLIESEEGKAVLHWSASDAADSDVQFVVQQSTDATFPRPKKLYEGPDLGTVVTGLAEGDYFFRVREVVSAAAPAEEWSETLTVRVKYPERKMVAMLMALGLVVFIGTVAVILVGHKRTSTEGTAS